MKSIILLSNLNYQKFPSSTPSENDEVPQIWIPILFSATTYNISFFSSTHTAKQWKNTAFPKWLWWIFDYIVPTILLSYLSHSNSRAYLLRPIVLLPFIAHSIADFFILTVIARNKDHVLSNEKIASKNEWKESTK